MGCSSTSRSSPRRTWWPGEPRWTCPLEVTCNATFADLQVDVTQKSGSGVARGFGFTSVGCTGSGQQVTVRVQASGGKTFKQGVAVASAEIFGCRSNVCGSETDSEVIDIVK